MKAVGFLGAYDKKDILIDAGKVLASLRYRVLIIDATTIQRFRYVVPQVTPQPVMTYISEYQGIDVALGFMNIEGIMRYLKTNELPYDFVFIDCDNLQTFNSFKIAQIQTLFIVTSYDVYDLYRLVDMLKCIPFPLNVTKLILSPIIGKKTRDYFDYLLGQTQVVLVHEPVYFPDTNQDRKATLENQLVREVRYRNHSNTYKDSLEYLVAIISEGIVEQKVISNVIKRDK